MLIPRAHLDAIRAGTVDTAFRAWARPRVLAGTKLRTAIGLVEVTSVQETSIAAIGEEDARRAGTSHDDLLAFLRRRPDHSVFRIGLRYAGPDPRIALREDDAVTPDARAAIAARLARLDRPAPWTARTLDLIERRPGVRAADLAAELGEETPAFKRRVRQLKELGLTESLEVGYRLSARGRAFRG